MEPNNSYPYSQVPPSSQPPPGQVYNYATPQYYPTPVGSAPEVQAGQVYYPPANYNQGYQQAPPYGYVPVQGYQGGHNPDLQYIYSKVSSECTCPHCHQRVMSDIVRRPGNTAWIVCLILCCFCFPLCLYPLICDPCLDTYHLCPHCKGVISVKTP